MRRSALVVIGLALIASASPHPTRAALSTSGSDDEWHRSSPETEGFDAERLRGLVERVRRGEFADVHGILVVRDDRLVLEEYFGGYDAARLHTLQSITKAVMSTLVGVALQRGEIDSVDRPVLSFFPEYQGLEHLDDRKRSLTLRHLLSMRTGMDWDEWRAPYASADNDLGVLNRSPGDWYRHVLDYPMAQAPGQSFAYNSGAAILVGGILRNVSGLRADRYADEHLFGPLGIEDRHWDFGGDGVPHTGGGLDLRPRDVAKLGLLWLNDGVWRGRRLLPPGWVAEATTPHTRFRVKGAMENLVGYGYMWWVASTEPSAEGPGSHRVFVASGHRGQFLFVAPHADLVVVVTSDNWDPDMSQRPLRFFFDTILPSTTGVTPNLGIAVPDREVVVETSQDLGEGSAAEADPKAVARRREDRSRQEQHRCLRQKARA